MKIKVKRKFKNSMKEFVTGFRRPHMFDIDGIQGSGKSSLGAAFLIYDKKYNGKWRKEMSDEKVTQLLFLGYDKVNYTSAFWHSNYSVLLNKRKQIFNNFTTFDKFGLPTADGNFHNYAFYSFLLYDEPELDIDGRAWTEFDSDKQYGGLKLKRHKGLTICKLVHNSTNTEKRVREDNDYVVYLYNLQPVLKRYLFGLFYSVTWYARIYFKSYGLEFMKLGYTGEIPSAPHLSKLIRWVRFTAWFNVFRRYDSLGFEPNWYVNEPFVELSHLSVDLVLKN